jgi:hypothetical protein
VGGSRLLAMKKSKLYGQDGPVVAARRFICDTYDAGIIDIDPNDLRVEHDRLTVCEDGDVIVTFRHVDMHSAVAGPETNWELLDGSVSLRMRRTKDGWVYVGG